MKDLPYRLGVGIVLLNAQGLAFAGRRIDNPTPAWQMPQGGIDEGEDPKQAAFREMKEEIGTDKAEIIAESKGWLSYDLPPDLSGQLWQGRYRGQKQKWYAMRFMGKESDINIATSHPEFSEWRWVDPYDLPSLIVPFKKTLYEAILQEFYGILNHR